jgi:hypothetical protein
MIGFHFLQIRFIHLTAIHHHIAPVMELATRRRFQQIGRSSRYESEFFHFLVE